MIVSQVPHTVVSYPSPLQSAVIGSTDAVLAFFKFLFMQACSVAKERVEKERLHVLGHQGKCS